MAHPYRDPLDHYNNRLRASEPTYRPPSPEPGRRGSMAGALVAIAVVAVIMAYGANRSSTHTARDSTILAPSTTGQGGR
jgi:hypothetical protein